MTLSVHVIFYFFFFFSSRRRHTRCSRDWSSDVCSSDLGLTRLVDKRKVRRDRADVFSTLAEGLKGKRAKDWGLIDDHFPTSKFDESIKGRVQQLATQQTVSGPGIKLNSLQDYKYVKIRLNREKRYADMTIHGPEGPQPGTPEEIHELGD